MDDDTDGQTGGRDHPEQGLPLALDPDAETSSPDLPAFLGKPPGAPVYHGFPVLHDIQSKASRSA